VSSPARASRRREAFGPDQVELVGDQPVAAELAGAADDDRVVAGSMR
jgi:hypothetical protein